MSHEGWVVKCVCVFEVFSDFKVQLKSVVCVRVRVRARVKATS